MADNAQAEAVVTPGETFVMAETTWGGDTAKSPGCFLGIVTGAEGSRVFNDYVGGAGAVSAGVQRVTLASDDPGVALLGTIDADTSGIITSVQLIDDCIYVDDADWTDNTSKHALVGGVYQSAPHTVTDGDVTPFLTDVNGRLAVVVSGTLTVASHAVTNAGTFPVQAAQSGTWTVDLGATDNAVLDAIAASLAGTLTVASHAVTNAGTFVVQVDGAALTALQLIDNIVHVDDAAFTLGTHSGVMMMGFAGTQSVDANDAAALACSTTGALFVTVASGGIASGAIASGAVASGAFASGALAAGSIATGAIADMLVDDAAFTPATSRVMPMGLQADEASIDSVDEGDVGCPRMTLDRKQIVTPLPHTAGGCSIFRTLDLDETEEDVKTSAGQVYGIYAFNTTNAILYLKIYNATAANVTVGTTTPVMTLPVPGNNDTDGAGFYMALPVGVSFDTAISAAATTGVADNDTGAPGANALVVQVFYK